MNELVMLLQKQGALSNFVGGLIILLLKPFKAGDYVRVGETEGTVFKIGAFYTEINTYDGKHVSLPNSNLTNTAIINYSSEKARWKWNAERFTLPAISARAISSVRWSSMYSTALLIVLIQSIRSPSFHN